MKDSVIHQVSIKKIGASNKEPNEYVRIGDEVDDLMKSIESIGQLNPIIIDPSLKILAGGRRFTAMKKLGLENIEARVFTMEDIDAQITVIDDNLIRKSLKGIDLDNALAERKRLYEVKYPETKKGGDTTKKRRIAKSAVSYVEDTANKTGKSKRSIENAVARSERSSPVLAQSMREGEIGQSKANQLVTLSHEQQEAIIPFVKGKTVEETKSIVELVKTQGVDAVVDVELVLNDAEKLFRKLVKQAKAMSKTIETCMSGDVLFQNMAWMEFALELGMLQKQIKRVMEKQK